jgi:hypothetical protein
MNLLFIFSYSYILKKILNQNYISIGSDDRYIYHPYEFNDNISINDIIKQEIIKKDIDLLQSNNISIDDKLHFLNNNGVPSPIKITDGGLMDDFLYNFPVD